MTFLSYRAKQSTQPIQAQRFKESLKALSDATSSIVRLLNSPAQDITPSALGTRLALFLNCLRMHHTQVIAIGALPDIDPPQLVEYLVELRQLRGSIARWLTIHAAQPSLIFVEIADFESQCWTVIGMGMVLIEGVNAEGIGGDCTMSSRFHQWWDKLATRPGGFSA
jgi:hypothetical protein